MVSLEDFVLALEMLMAEWLSIFFPHLKHCPESMVDVRVEYLVGGLEHEFYDFPYVLGMSSSQLTNSIIFQRVRSTTNQICSTTDIWDLGTYKLGCFLRTRGMENVFVVSSQTW